MEDSPGLHILIIRVAGNDEHAKQMLYETLEQPLIRHITKKFGSTFTQEDIYEIFCQAYLQILIKAYTYRGDHGDASAWRWAYQVARSQAHKWLRTRKRIVTVVHDDRDEDSLTEEERFTLFAHKVDPDWIGRTKYETEDQALEQILVDQMIECFKHLNQRERQVVHMYHFENMSLEEIACCFGVTRTRIHQVLHGAYKKCHALMGLEQIAQL